MHDVELAQQADPTYDTNPDLSHSIREPVQCQAEATEGQAEKGAAGFKEQQDRPTGGSEHKVAEEEQGDNPLDLPGQPQASLMAQTSAPEPEQETLM